jgi:DNA-binding transcriptional ArsR family regulator
MFMNTHVSSPSAHPPDDREARHRPAAASSHPTALSGALIGPQAAAGLAETFKVLGDQTRVRMLDALSHSELCVGDLAGLLGLSESAVSHQLRLLRSMRLVRSRRAGRMVIYMLDDDHILRLVRQGLDHVEESSGAVGGGER